MNDNNLDFYSKMGVNPFKELAVMGGFSTFIDLELIYPYIKFSNSILELGAGYGRCLDFFLQKKFTGKIIAIEQSAVLMTELRSKFDKYNNVELLQKDIKSLKLSEKVDAALWMWSGLIDFDKDQQYACIEKMYNLLNPGGTLVIDIPRIGFKTIAEHKDEKNLSFTTPYGTLHCYIPDVREMEEAKNEIGYKELRLMNYKTATDKERTIYMLIK
jgi:SAM-dependent methyltransferase